MKNPSFLIDDILNSIRSIEKYIPESFSKFETDEIIQVFCKYHLQIMGEEASKLPNDFVHLYDKIDWSRMIGMRNVLVHNYSNVDLGILWRTINMDLPKVKEQLLDLKKSINFNVS